MSRFVVEVTFGEDPRRLAVRAAHREHLRALKEQGRLVTAGPWADDSGALHVYETGDEAGLRAILSADPYADVDGCEVVSVREWTPIM